MNGILPNSTHPLLTEKPIKNQLMEQKITPHKCYFNPNIVNGIVSKNNTDTECSQMIISIVKHMGLRGILFLGDSTMSYLWKEAHKIEHRYPLPSKNIASSRCDWLQSFGIKPSKVWRMPNRTREGPVAYGLDHHWCTDCSGCNTFMAVPKSNEDNKLLMDYIAVEFARDVEMQSVYGNTTQETLSRYLQLEGKLYSLCVINSGVHDMVISGLTTFDYILNVKEYLELVFPVCLHIVWIETTAPRGDKGYRQTVAVTREWNSALNSLLKTYFHHRVSVVHVFEKSLKATHVDNIHLHVSWYRELARSLFEKVLDLA